jgi:hypothetical protein
MRSGITAVFIIMVLLCAMAGIATAATVTQNINYQGKLIDHGTPPTGDRSITFLLWDAVTDGNLLQEIPQTVHCTEGMFNTNIPISSSFFDGRALWLGIQAGADDEMVPRQEIRPVPYALSLRPGATIGSSVYGSDGVNIKTTGSHSLGLIVNTTNSDSPGIKITTWNSRSEGIIVSTYATGCPGIYSDSDAGFGVQAISHSSSAIYADTWKEDHKYGLQTPDIVRALNYETGSSDVAEYMPVIENVPPGTVMIIGDDGKLAESITAYDTRVAGIVSTAPGVSLGTKDTGNPGEEQIAIGGRVPCKVDATKAPIHAGDLLTTSELPGHAMKAVPDIINGRKYYPDGTVLGKAMGTLESGTGVIEVLVTLQ